jgi:hypothetical protein
MGNQAIAEFQENHGTHFWLFGSLVVFFLVVLFNGLKVDREYERGVIFVRLRNKPIVSPKNP